MTILQTLSDLKAQMEIARDEASQAHQIYCDARDKLAEMERFKNETFSVGTIACINSEGLGNSCMVLTDYYKLDGGTVLFTIVEAYGSDDRITYIGQIVDYAEKTVLYACQFYCNYGEYQDLFDYLLVNYAEWRFNL